MIRLREIEKRDLDKIKMWHNDLKLSENLGGVYRFVNDDVEKNWYEQYLSTRNSNVRCAILRDEELVGCVYLLNIDGINRCGDLHIMLGDERYRRQGIGTYAVRTMINHAFYNLNLRRIQLEVLATNTAAQALYLKVGFLQEGIKRKAVYKNGQYVDEILMALIKDDCS